MILQPKRWQNADDPRYDPIRHHAWFKRLLKRKKALQKMEGCYAQWKQDGPLNQNELCDLWNVSPREFRDYSAFIEGYFTPPSLVFQEILNNAYETYKVHEASKPIQRFIAIVAPLYGVNYRHVWEKWEIDPEFYPYRYEYPTK